MTTPHAHPNTTEKQHTLTQQVNTAIVAYVAAAHARGGRPTFAELYDVFDQPDMAGPRNLKTANTPLTVFRSRIQHLVETQRLRAVGKGMARQFFPYEREDLGAVSEDEAPAPYVDAYKGAIVPPRQYDVMHGALYTPEADWPVRAGALDYKRFPSVGHAC